MNLMDELRSIATQLTESQAHSVNEDRLILAALVWYLDTRLNQAAPPPNTDLEPEHLRQQRSIVTPSRPSAWERGPDGIQRRLI